MIELAIHRLTHVLRLSGGQSLIVDYRGQPVQHLPDGRRVVLAELAPLGEADVKFARYSTMFDRLLVDSVDGDSVAIALLLREREGDGGAQVSIYRMETRLPGSKQLPPAGVKRAAPEKERRKRTYEYVNIPMLYDMLRCMVAPQCDECSRMETHEGHEAAMLVALIGLTGTDFTRGLPLVGAKSVYEALPHLWVRLARAFDPRTGQLDPERTVDLVVAALYQIKFRKHTPAGGGVGLEPVLAALRGSGLSERTRGMLPTAPALLCTVRNVNWLLRYWAELAPPDPVQPQFGFARDRPGGAVRYAD